jgi:urocanate hydratase
MTNLGANEDRGVSAARGSALSCKGWEQEGALRMLMNCADPALAERGAGERDGNDFLATIAALRDLENDQTLLVRSGKPAGAFRARSEAPRVVMTAGGFAGRSGAAAACWLCAGTQTGLAVMYEAVAGAARKHFGGTLAGRLVMAGGMGATGGSLPLAATLNGAAFLGVEADPEQIKRRVKSGYCEVMVNDLDEALRILKNSVRKREAASVGLIGNCADVIPELARRGIVPDLLVDCTSAYGSLDAYVPSEMTAGQAREARRADPGGYRQRAMDSVATQFGGILELKRLGSLAFQFGGGHGERTSKDGASEAPAIPDFEAGYIQPLRAAGRALLLWVALSGEPADIARADRLALDLFPADEATARWIRLARKHVQFQGLPARVCLVDEALRANFGVALNDLVAQGALKAPIVIGCEDFGHGTEMSTAPTATAAAPATGADKTIEALLAGSSDRARVASWVAIEEGKGGGTNASRLPMLAIVADGTAEMARRIERVLASDPSRGQRAAG